MKQNIYQRRILQWEKQYGNLSLHAQKKLKNLLEEFEKSSEFIKISEVNIDTDPGFARK